MYNLLYSLITAGIATFVTYSGYCAYRKTREQLKLKCTYDIFENRLIEILHIEANKNNNYKELNELSSPEVRRDYFMKKVEAANLCINSGDYDLSVEYLMHAMAVCSKPAALLQCMSKTLPRNVYKLLIEKLSSLA